VAAFDGAEDLLRTLFGFAAFRAGQAEIIETILAGRDVLAVMPTGRGKSLYDQLCRDRHDFRRRRAGIEGSAILHCTSRCVSKPAILPAAPISAHLKNPSHFQGLALRLGRRFRL